MKTIFRELEFSTDARRKLVDITSQTEKVVAESEIDKGLCLVHSLHSTTAIIINEHEAGLMDDILQKIADDYQRSTGWRHDRIDDNADAHLASVFVGSSKTLPVKDGRLVRGTWQSIFFLELDGPRAARKVVIEVLGE